MGETLVQGILVASTALLGISGVFAAQLRFSPMKGVKQRLEKDEYDKIKCLLFFSITFGFFTILLAFSFFLFNENFCLAIATTVLVIFQLLLFTMIIWKYFNPCHTKKRAEDKPEEERNYLEEIADELKGIHKVLKKKD